MRLKCQECGDFIRETLSCIMSRLSPDLGVDFSNTALKIPVWYIAVSEPISGPEGAEAITGSLHLDLVEESRSIAYSWEKLVSILCTGIDVMPTTSTIYSGRLEKSLFYGDWPKIVMILDRVKLKPTWKMLNKNATSDEIEEVKKTYPYMMVARNGDYWFSRVEDEVRRFSGYEQGYAHWIPGDAREALQCVLILDKDLSPESDDNAVKDRLCLLLSVALQDFLTSSSGINWTRPIPELDKLLFVRYGLTASERSFIIEKMTKSGA